VLRVRINHSAAGLFAYFVFALNQLHVATRLGLTPYVYYGELSSDGRNKYYDANHGDNVWEYFFQPVSAANHSNTPPEEMVELDVGALWYLHNDAPDSIRSFPYGVDRARRCAYDEAWVGGMRARATQLIEQFVRVKPHVSAKVDAFWQQKLAACEKVIGVHVRGTDKNPVIGGAIQPPELYFPAIDTLLEASPESCIFAATDQQQFAQSLISRYGDRVSMYESLRSPSELNVFLDTDIKGNYRKGEEAVVVMLLLSRCHHLLKPHSALSETAIYFNPALHAHSQEIGYAHPPEDCPPPPEPTDASVVNPSSMAAPPSPSPPPQPSSEGGDEGDEAVVPESASPQPADATDAERFPFEWLAPLPSREALASGESAEGAEGGEGGAEPAASPSGKERGESGSVGVARGSCPDDCHGRGVCNPTLRECRCVAGWGGRACEQRQQRRCNELPNQKSASLCDGACADDRGLCYCNGTHPDRPLPMQVRV